MGRSRVMEAEPNRSTESVDVDRVFAEQTDQYVIITKDELDELRERRPAAFTEGEVRVSRRQNRTSSRREMPRRTQQRERQRSVPVEAKPKEHSHALGRTALAAARLVYKAHKVVYSELMDMGTGGRVVAGVLALAEVGVPITMLHEDTATRAEEARCNDAGHQMVQVGSNNSLINFAETARDAPGRFKNAATSIVTGKNSFIGHNLTSTAIANTLSEARGYTISGARVAEANPQLFNEKGSLTEHGPECMNVPGPIVYGFAEADGGKTIGDYRKEFLLDADQFAKLNPGLHESDDYKPTAGTVIKWRKHFDTSLVLTTAKEDLAAMTHGKDRQSDMYRLVHLNAFAFGNGGKIKAGDPAYLPLEQTKSDKKFGITVSDIINEYDSSYKHLPKTQSIEPKHHHEQQLLHMPSRFAKRIVHNAYKQLHMWPKGETDNWHGVENSNPYIAKYTHGELGHEVSWCSYFQIYLMNQAGYHVPTTAHLGGETYFLPRVKDLYNWMVNDNNHDFYVYNRDSILKEQKTDYQPGDIMFFNANGSMDDFQHGTANHVGLVVKVEGDKVWVIDGNYYKTDKVSLRVIRRNNPEIVAISRAIEERTQVNGVEIPKLRDLTHEQSTRATEVLKEQGPQWHNRAVAMRYLMDKARLKDFQAAALIGGFQVESADASLPPEIHQFHGGPAIGIAQWEGIRQERLIKFAHEHKEPWNSLHLQLKFILHEFNGHEQGAYDWLRNTTSLPAAADAALNGYERPAARVVDLRLQYAAEWLKDYYAAAK